MRQNQVILCSGILLFSMAVLLLQHPSLAQAQLMAGAAKIDVTHPTQLPINDRLYVRALVLQNVKTRAVIISIDAVAIGEIGPINNDYLPTVRTAIQTTHGIAPTNVMINASHCHGIVCNDVDQKTIEAVNQALSNLQPVNVGVAHGHEDRIMENRRLQMKDGTEIDVRHAYSLPPDDEVASVGPVDSEIGVLRIDRQDGSVLAVLYNFACHPIQGVPGGANTADITGYASRVIEENLSDGCIALFLQGCGGDINPIHYKDVHHPRHAEPLGNLLGLSTLRAIRSIKPEADNRLQIINRTVELPRADVAAKIIELENERLRLAQSFRGTSLNQKSFLQLMVKYGLHPDYPSLASHGYLHERAIGRSDLEQLDAENRRLMKAYLDNVLRMERLTRLNTNLELLRRHQQKHLAATQRAIKAEILAIRVGGFVMTTFPGELTVRIGLRLKQRSPHPHTFVAGYTNGYLYYAPTTEQLRNRGNAQEDSDCILASEWQATYEREALHILSEL